MIMKPKEKKVRLTIPAILAPQVRRMVEQYYKNVKVFEPTASAAAKYEQYYIKKTLRSV